MLTIVIYILIFSIKGYNCGNNDSAVKCKWRYDVSFPTVKMFTDYMCAECFYMMGEVEDAWSNIDRIKNLLPCTDHTKEAYLCRDNCPKNRPLENVDACSKLEYDKLNKSNVENDVFLREFKKDFHMDLFLQCCADAKNCCEKLGSNEISITGKCPSKWDGWMCWDSAEAGTTVWKKCPAASFAALNSIPTECSNEYASKECYENGTWGLMWADEQYPIEYTNYFTCSTPGATEYIRQTRTAIAVYFISLAFTLTGVIIFIIFKQYHMLRVKIHLNFFCSLILTCIFSILFQFMVRERHYKLESVVSKNPLWCKALYALSKTSRLATYCWMLNEGIYLRQLFASAFQEHQRMLYYLLFGWGMPIIIMIPYVIVHSLERYDNNCWTESMLYPELIYNTLPLICIGLNIILLLNVVIVLMTKFMQSPEHFKRALRSCLLLIPIFGVQYVFYIVPIEPLQSCTTGSFAARYIQIIIEALQGAIIATVFCFGNGEVHSHIRRLTRRRFLRNKEMITEEFEIGNCIT